MKEKDEVTTPKGSPIASWLMIVSWMVLGSTMVLFNKAVLSSWDFNYPFFLTAWHCLVATIFTRVLGKYTSYMPGVNDEKVTNKIFYFKIVPIALFFALGLLCGNTAYSYLSVSYIQMLKSFTPIPMLFMAYITGRERPSLIQLFLIMIISTGVAITSAGEAQFTIIGFFMQIVAILCDVSRTTLLDLTLTDINLDTLSTLYYMMPPSFIFISAGFYYQEAAHFPWERLANSQFGYIMLINGFLAFLLNISVVLVVKYTSPLTLSLSGILKDITLVTVSSFIFNTMISSLQVLGYAVSIIGLLSYRTYKQDQKLVHERLESYQHNMIHMISSICNACIHCRFRSLLIPSKIHMSDDDDDDDCMCRHDSVEVEMSLAADANHIIEKA